MESTSISSGLALMFGTLHALEPGHGKTALLTYIASGKRTWKEGLIISVSSAITHSLAVFFIAFISHYLIHHGAIEFRVAYIENILSIMSGALISGLGLWIIFKDRKGYSHSSCSSCTSHKPTTDKGVNRSGFLTSGILGIATGMIPCPSVVVAYLSGVSTGNSLLGVQSVIFFAIGMCLSLMSVILFFSIGGEQALQKFKGKKIKLNWNLVQGIIFIIIGLGTAFYH